MRDLLEYLARALVDEPDSVSVEQFEEADGTIVLELAVAEDDYGKIIGRGGRTANALRAVVKAAAVKENRRVLVDIVDCRGRALRRRGRPRVGGRLRRRRPGRPPARPRRVVLRPRCAARAAAPGRTRPDRRPRGRGRPPRRDRRAPDRAAPGRRGARGRGGS